MTVKAATRTVAPASPRDRRFRRTAVAPGRRKPKARAFSWATFRVAMVGLVLAAMAGLVMRELLLSPQFHVHRFAIQGHHRLSRGEVVALLDGLQGQHLLTVDLEAWRKKLLESPWVAEARLHRVLPGTIDVVIAERAPAATARIGTQIFLVDGEGGVIDEYGPQYQDLDLPIIDGLTPASPDAPERVSRAALAGRLVQALSARPDLYARVSQIDVHDARNAVVTLEGEGVRVYLGDTEFVDRLQTYVELAPSLQSRIPGLDYVDLRFGTRIYARPLPGSPVPKATTASLP